MLPDAKRIGGDACKEIDVKFHGEFCAGGSISITLAGGTSMTNQGEGCGTYTKTDPAIVHLKPNVSYTLKVHADEAASAYVSLEVG